MDVNPHHYDGEWLVPLASKATGQPLLVHSVLAVKNTLSGTHEWYEGGMKFLGSRAVLYLLGGRGTVGNGFSGEVVLDVAWSISINDVIIEKRHPATLPEPQTIKSAWSIDQPCQSFQE